MPHLPKTQYTGLSSKHHRVPRDHQVLPEHLVAMVRPGYRVKLAHPGHKVHGDSLVPMVKQASQVNQVFKVLRALSGHRAEMVRMERMEHVEKLERPVPLVLLANKVCKVLPGHKVHGDLLVPMVNLAQKVHIPVTMRWKLMSKQRGRL